MDDYIKRSDVLALQTELRFDQIEQLKHYRCKHIDPLSVELLDAADVVEVVRCKDCKHRRTYKNYREKGYMDIKAVCDLDSADPYELSRNAEEDDWFCADGERKTEDG